jgi:hypothetical protein
MNALCNRLEKYKWIRFESNRRIYKQFIQLYLGQFDSLHQINDKYSLSLCKFNQVFHII